MYADMRGWQSMVKCARLRMKIRTLVPLVAA